MHSTSGSAQRERLGDMTGTLLNIAAVLIGGIIGLIFGGRIPDKLKETIIAAMAFTSTLGVGVMFSTIIILVYQGGVSLLAAQLNALVTPSMMNELTATGGVILVGLAISSLLEIKKIRVGNMLPGLAIAPLIVWILSLF
jgi:uncharacterized membrane protein YqgA involved in biofilm formation